MKKPIPFRSLNEPIPLSCEEAAWFQGILFPEIERGGAWTCAACCAKAVTYRIGWRLFCSRCAVLGPEKAAHQARLPMKRAA